MPLHNAAFVMQVRWTRKYLSANGTVRSSQLIADDMALEDNIHYALEKPTPFEWKLRIRSIQVSDEGIYECAVQVTLNAFSSDYRRLIVYCKINACYDSDQIIVVSKR